MNDKTNWTTKDIPDQHGRVAIVTGSSSGIGLETARQLALKGATVVIAVRNQTKGEEALRSIHASAADADLQLMDLDLASLDAVRRFAEAFAARFERLDLLINNAGVMFPPYSKTEDSFELQLGTNHLGHFALTARLFDRLRATPGSRVVNVSSIAHNAGDLDFSDLSWEQRSYSRQQAYGDSKLANLYFSFELARRLKPLGNHPLVTAAHPGWTATDLQRHVSFLGFLNRIFAQDVEMGALPTLRAACDEAARPGDYFGPGGWAHIRGYPVAHDPVDKARDAENAQRLWALSEQMTGLRFDPARGSDGVRVKSAIAAT